MGPLTGIRVENLAQVVRDLERLGVEIGDLKAAFGRISTKAIPMYRRFTPRESGALQSNYRASKTKNRALIRVGSARIPYAGVHNWGWPARGIPAKSFVRQGDMRVRPTAAADIQREINYLITKYGF